jgi:pentatricopeptide repeat protein
VAASQEASLGQLSSNEIGLCSSLLGQVHDLEPVSTPTAAPHASVVCSTTSNKVSGVSTLDDAHPRLSAQNTLIDVYGKLGQWSDALDVLQEMLSQVWLWLAGKLSLTSGSSLAELSLRQATLLAKSGLSQRGFWWALDAAPPHRFAGAVVHLSVAWGTATSRQM